MNFAVGLALCNLRKYDLHLIRTKCTKCCIYTSRALIIRCFRCKTILCFVKTINRYKCKILNIHGEGILLHVRENIPSQGPLHALYIKAILYEKIVFLIRRVFSNGKWDKSPKIYIFCITCFVLKHSRLKSRLSID